MDFDDNPTARYFDDDSFVVQTGATRYEEAILWMSFYEADQSMNLSVYDSAQHEYTHTFAGSSAADVEVFIKQVATDYNTVIPTQFTALPSQFLKLVGQSFGVVEELDEKPTYCDQCGDMNGSSMEAYYFPTINKKFPAVLSVRWNFGCFGGTVAYGEVSAVKTEVLEQLNRAVDNAEVAEAAARVQEFITQVENL